MARLSAFSIVLAVLLILVISGSTVMAQNVLADTGFRPDQNGFSFENYGNESQPVNLTPAAMQKVFGDRVCKAVQDGECVLTATSQEWMDKVNTDMGGGHCEGMAILSNLIYTGDVKIKDLDPNAESIADLTPDNPNVQTEIARWFATQYVPPSTSAQMNEQTPNEVVDTLVERMQTEKGPFTLAFYQANGEGGHAVTPYSAVDMGDGTTRIMVYDNNYPGQERFIEVNKETNSWKYTGTTNPDEPVSEYSGTAESFSLNLRPNAARLIQPQECEFCKPDDGGIGADAGAQATAEAGATEEAVSTEEAASATEEAVSTEEAASATEEAVSTEEATATEEASTAEEGTPEEGAASETTDECGTAVTTGPNTDMVVTTEDGHQAGIVNGQAFSDIEGAVVVRPVSQLDGDTPGAIVMLPSDSGDLSVTVRGEGGDDVLMLACGQYQHVSGMSQEDGEADTLTFSEDASAVTGEVDPDESVTFKGGYDNPEGDDQTYALNDVTSEEGAIVSVGADPETGDFKVETSGQTDFDVVITSTDQNGDTYETEFTDAGTTGEEALSINLIDAVYAEESNFEVSEADPATFDEFADARDASKAAFDEIDAETAEEQALEETDQDEGSTDEETEEPEEGVDGESTDEEAVDAEPTEEATIESEDTSEDGSTSEDTSTTDESGDSAGGTSEEGE